jgi:hypothetical protein
MASSVILPGSPPTIDFGFEQAREFILEPFYNNPVLSAWSTIDQDIVGKKQLAYMGLYGKNGKLETGCGFTSDGSLTTSEKYWTPQPIQGQFEQCWNDIFQSLILYGQKAGFERKDLLTNTVWSSFIIDLLGDTLLQNYIRRVWFGDTAIVAGDLTNGAGDVAYYSAYDGFWKQIFDGVTATDITRYTITENAASTAAGQLTLASDRAYASFKSMYENVDTRLLQEEDLVILCTRTLFDNYAAYLESKDTFNSFERIEGGYRQLMFRGIPVIQMDIWDRTIQSDFLTGSPATYDSPNRAIMTRPANLRLGLDSSQSMSAIDQWYSKDDQVWRAQYNTMEDAKVVHDFLVAAAY